MQKIKQVFLFFTLAVILFFAVFAINTIKNLVNTPSVTIKMSETTVIKELRSLNRLETASFTIEKVIEAGTSGNVFQEFLYGDRILLIATGHVIAGFDFSTLTDRDIQVRGKEVKVTLPKPQILVTSIDNGQTRVYDRKQGILSKNNKDLEAKARLAAENSIRDAACKGGILNEASENARKQVSSLLKILGFETITVDVSEGSC